MMCLFTWCVRNIDDIYSNKETSYYISNKIIYHNYLWKLYYFTSQVVYSPIFVNIILISYNRKIKLFGLIYLNPCIAFSISQLTLESIITLTIFFFGWPRMHNVLRKHLTKRRGAIHVHNIKKSNLLLCQTNQSHAIHKSEKDKKGNLISLSDCKNKVLRSTYFQLSTRLHQSLKCSSMTSFFCVSWLLPHLLAMFF